LAFPTSDYYGGSATIVEHPWTAHVIISTIASRMLANAFKRNALGAGYDQPNQYSTGS